MSESSDQKASRYLVEGRVAALLVDNSRGHFQVKGSDDDPYEIFYRGEWTCNCPARVLECAHILACKKIVSFNPVGSKALNSESDDITRLISEALGVDT